MDSYKVNELNNDNPLTAIWNSKHLIVPEENLKKGKN